MIPRLFLAAGACILLAGGVPARAAEPYEKSGSVLLMAEPNPMISRMVYGLDQDYGLGANGTVGYVWKLPKAAIGERYTLKRTAGLTGDEDLDVWFCRSLDPPVGAPCERPAYNEGDITETGWIDPDATQLWAVVYLQRGARATFKFSYLDEH